MKENNPKPAIDSAENVDYIALTEPLREELNKKILIKQEITEKFPSMFLGPLMAAYGQNSMRFPVTAARVQVAYHILQQPEFHRIEIAFGRVIMHWLKLYGSLLDVTVFEVAEILRTAVFYQKNPMDISAMHARVAAIRNNT